MKCFPKLNQTHVRIELAGGDTISVPMLPVSTLDSYHRISEELKSVKGLGNEEGLARLEEIKGELIDIVSTVLPEFKENLRRFDIRKLVELFGYLLFGDDDDQPKEKSVSAVGSKKADGKGDGEEDAKKNS